MHLKYAKYNNHITLLKTYIQLNLCSYWHTDDAYKHRQLRGCAYHFQRFVYQSLCRVSALWLSLHCNNILKENKTKRCKQKANIYIRHGRHPGTLKSNVIFVKLRQKVKFSQWPYFTFKYTVHAFWLFN